MRRIPRPSPAMAVALIALMVAIGGTAVALPGKFTVGRDDLKTSSVGARALGRIMLEQISLLRSTDAIAGDGQFKEVEGTVSCPGRAPFAFDPSVGPMGPDAFEMSLLSIPNRWSGPGGYRMKVLSDKGPNFAFTMRVNCLPAR
jgi:hypothetical protein